MTRPPDSPDSGRWDARAILGVLAIAALIALLLYMTWLAAPIMRP